MSKNEQVNAPVDFNDPASLEAELAAAGTEVKAPKAKKPAKPKVVTITVTEEIAALKVGETFEYEIPKSLSSRGAVAGIPLDEMTDDQLKIEYRNANSVHYKTAKAGRDITKAAARLDAAKAELEKRGIAPSSRGTTVVDANAVANLIKSGKISVEELQALLEQ